MVTLSDIQASNAKLATTLPEGLVAVFVGGTRGIGETSLKQFAKHARKPRIYLIGRSEANANRVIDECKALNNEGQYIFIGADISLIRSVDEVCKDIASRERAINLLFVTPGTFTVHTETLEKLHFFMSLNYYARTRFILNLLPLLRVAVTAWPHLGPHRAVKHSRKRRQSRDPETDRTEGVRLIERKEFD